MNNTYATQMNDDDIITYLKSNPKFLQKNPDAIDYLIPPKDSENGRKVADFQHYMVEKLKADKQSVLNTTRDIIEVSRENMNNLARIHEAVLKILEAETFDQFIQILSVDVAAALDCDAVTLIVDQDSRLLETQQRSLRIMAPGTCASWMGDNAAIIQSNIKGHVDIFGEAAGLVQSQALLKINMTMDIPPSVLAFGSRDPEMFTDAQGTDLIRFLCDVTERALRLWLR